MVFLIALSLVAFNSPDKNTLEENLKKHVYTLASEIGERNFSQYENLQKAKDYIIRTFKGYGYLPEEQKYSLEGKSYSNIIATRYGRKDEIIIVGAHYDSVYGSPGADDNASGVAVLLELANLFSKTELERTLKFIAFTNEEPPFLFTGDMGSMVYVKEARKTNENIKAMLSLEMLGYYTDEKGIQEYPPGLGFFYPEKGNFIAVAGNIFSRRLVKKVVKTFRKYSSFPAEYLIGPAFLIPAISLSDHSSFWREGIPALMVTDTAFYRNPNYHKQSDLPQTLDYQSMTEVLNGLYYALLRLTNE